MNQLISQNVVWFSSSQIKSLLGIKKIGQTGLSVIHKMHKKHDKLEFWDERPILYIHKYFDTPIKM